MDNKVKSRFSGKYVILLFITLLVFTKSFAVEYIVPKKPASVDVADIDLDDDLDIVLGHDPTEEQGWGGISVFENDSNGTFCLIDSLFILSYQPSIRISLVDNNEITDFIAKCYDYETGTTCFEIIYNYYNELFNNINIFSCNEAITISDYNVFHLESISLANIVFISHNNQSMGILNNNGFGQFSLPEYYDLDYNPSGLACGDLNGDNRDDIIVCGGAYIDSWINYPTGLQYVNICDSAYVSRIEIADIDQDGNNDIIAIRWGMPGVPKRLFIYLNDGMSNFYLSYDKWIDEAMAKIHVADLNNNSYPDVIYNVSYSYPNSNYELFHTYILFNNQDGTFQDPVNYYTGICSHKSYSADLDGNGWNDIITLNYDFYNPPPDTGSIHILFNDGTGNFVEEPQVGINQNCILTIEDCELSNYPNPFNPSTTISFNLQEEGEIKLEIYNIKGQKVKTLIALPNGGLGTRDSVTWDGTDENNQPVSSGIYFYKLNVSGKTEAVKKCLLLK